MSRTIRTLSVGIVCAGAIIGVVVDPAHAETISWRANESGIWNLAANWDTPTGFPPGANDDAKHLKMLNHIQVAGNRSCLSFEGTSGVVDRFLLIESNKTLQIGQGGLFKSTGAGMPVANFPVRMKNGVAPNKTTVDVQGPIDGIDFGPAPKQKGDHVKITCRSDLKNSSIALGDESTVWTAGTGFQDIASTNITLGDGAIINFDGRDVTGPGNHTVGWTIGDDGIVNIRYSGGGGDVSGVDMTIGTGAATASEDTRVNIRSVGFTSLPISDTWLLRGYADVAIDLHFWAAGENATIVLQDDAKMSIGGSALGGAWEVKDEAASLSVGGDFDAATLLVDGATVNGYRLGHKTGPVWDLTVQNGGKIITEDQGGLLGQLALSGTWFGHTDNSVLTYSGLGNSVHTSAVDIGGELVRGGWAADLEIGVDEQFLVATELVRVENGQTFTTPFDSENVTIVVEGTGPLKTVESIGPDYEGYNEREVLFADSPCVRRWEKLLVQSGTFAHAVDDICNTPISGHVDSLSCPAGPPPGGVPEAMYVIDLEVEGGATLMAGINVEPVADVNIYYTGAVTGEGNIVDGAGQPYVPIRLTPTLYGDFNGDGDGDEPDEPGSDTRRFNAAFCSCLEFDARYDPLVDWNCDGFIDDADRDQYNATWKDPAGLTTDPCNPGFCGT